MFNTMRYEDEKDRIIRQDSLMVSLSSKLKTVLEKMDFLTSSYCLNILIKKDLEEFKEEDSNTTFEEVMKKIQTNHSKFIEALSHDSEHNKKKKPITQKAYINSLKILEEVVKRNENASLLIKKFFQCLLPGKLPLKLSPDPENRINFINDIQACLGGTNVIINDILRLSSCQS